MTPKTRKSSPKPTMIAAQSPMLIQAMIRVAVLSPAPSTAPFDRSISFEDSRARIRATIAGITGQNTQEITARISPTIALDDVGGDGR